MDACQRLPLGTPPTPLYAKLEDGEALWDGNGVGKFEYRQNKRVAIFWQPPDFTGGRDRS